MKHHKLSLITLPLLLLTMTAFAADSKVIKDIKNTFGIVPTFLKEFPADALPGAWQEMKDLQLNDQTALSPKVKELIGLAVASQIPCRYCTYFHRKAAMMNGASKEELNLAIAVSANARKWAAFFNGAQTDLPTFKSETDRMIMHLSTIDPKNPMQPEIQITDINSVYKDMENNFGFVPSFVRSYSQSALPGAWKELKSVMMSPNTVLTPKTKDLISLAVGSQVPCNYCVYIDTSFAKLDGASNTEIQESIAMAGLVRHWSTFLNGIQQDEKSFEKEADEIFRYAKAHQPKTVAKTH